MNRSSLVVRTVTYLFLTVIAVASVVPFAWSIVSSLKSQTEIFQQPYSWIPSAWAWRNYLEVFKEAPFGRFFLNTGIEVAGRVVIDVLAASMAGYALARKKFPGRDLIFFLVLALMMIPMEATVVPLFIIMKRFPFVGGNNILGIGGSGLVNTYTGLIIPFAVRPFDVFVMRQFFWSLPVSLEDAGRIDGASQWQMFYRIALPLARAGMVAVAIFAFEGAWNDFIWPLIIIRSKLMQTIQLGLQTFQSETNAHWQILMAGTVVILVPMLIVFVIFQRYFFRGFSFAGVSDK